MPTYSPFQYSTVYRFDGGKGKGPAFRYGVQPIVPVNPVIQNVTGGPSIGTQTLWHLEFLLLPVNGAITRMILWVEFTGGGTEVIWDGDKFTAEYTGRSVKADLGSGRLSFDVIRNGGWPKSPRVFAHANTDRGGMTVG